jgi:glycosyltransferase involved in cell wall biosynthesis
VAAGWLRSTDDGYEGKLADRERSEWRLADLVICASDFVRDGVIASGGDAGKCVVVPYGVDASDYKPNPAANDPGHKSDALNVLFAGGVGLRKGVPYLFEAMRGLGDASIRCRVVGGWSVDEGFLRSQCPPNVELVGAVPRSAMQKEYARADVFCLPSLCEGSATVIYEALAAGLPVVTTSSSGSIVRDGVEGIIVPARDAGSIAAAFERLQDRSVLAEMARAASVRSQFGSLAAYSQRLLDALDRVVKP